MFELLDITKEEQNQFLKQARRVLSSYRQLKKSYQLALPQAHTQHYDNVSTSKGSRKAPAIGERWKKIDKNLTEIEQVLNKMYPEYRQILLERYHEKLGFCEQAEKYGYGLSRWHQYITLACLEFADKGDIKPLNQPLQKPSKKLIEAIKLAK